MEGRGAGQAATRGAGLVRRTGRPRAGEAPGKGRHDARRPASDLAPLLPSPCASLAEKEHEETYLGNGALELLHTDEQQAARGLVLLPQVVAREGRRDREAEQEAEEAAPERADGPLGLRVVLPVGRLVAHRGKT